MLRAWYALGTGEALHVHMRLHHREHRIHSAHEFSTAGQIRGALAHGRCLRRQPVPLVGDGVDKINRKLLNDIHCIQQKPTRVSAPERQTKKPEAVGFNHHECAGQSISRTMQGAFGNRTNAKATRTWNSVGLTERGNLLLIDDVTFLRVHT
jgi:hypothetical protein